MDELLAKLSGQAVSLVGKAAFGLATKVAMEQVNKFINSSNKKQSIELESLKKEFQMRLNVISPAMELIEVAISRGNSSLESIIDMTDNLRNNIEEFNKRNVSTQNGKEVPVNAVEIVIKDIDKLIKQLDSSISYIHLVLSLTKVDLNSKLPKGISPSRLLQASTLLNCVAQIPNDKVIKVGKQVGFTLYSLFLSSSRPKGKQDFTWKEEYALCQGWIQRLPTKDIVYEMILKEDFNDGRAHEDEKPMQKNILVEDIKSLYYSSSGKLLNIEDTTSPVLVLKIEKNNSKDKFEYIALAINNYEEKEEEEEEEKNNKVETSEKTTAITNSKEINQIETLKQLILPTKEQSKQKLPSSALSLFEYILRLASAEVSEQKSHVIIKDEMLARYLQDSYISKESSIPK